jgi:hypothetical protein
VPEGLVGGAGVWAEAGSMSLTFVLGVAAAQIYQRWRTR